MTDVLDLSLALDFIGQHTQTLPGERLIVLSIIKMLGNDHAGQVSIPVHKIADITGLDERTVQRYISKLKIRNLLEIERSYVKGLGGYKGPNKYRLIGWPEWVEKHAQ